MAGQESAESTSDELTPFLREFLTSDKSGSASPELGLSTAADLHLIVDSTFRVSFVGVQPEGCDALGKTLLDIVSSPVRQDVREASERCVKTGHTERLNIRLATAPQTELAASLSSFESAEGTGLIIVAIEQPKTLAPDLDFQLEVQRHVLDVMDVAIFWKDRESRFLGANKKFLSILGAERLSDVLGKDDFEFFSEESALHYRQDDELVMSSGEPSIEYVETIVSTHGPSETLVTTKLPVFDTNGEVIGVTGYFRVITPEMQTKQELRNLEGRFALALQASREGVWEYDLETGMFEVTERFTELVGLEPTDRHLTVERIQAVFGFGTIEHVSRAVEALIDDPTKPLEFRPTSMEVNGETRWIDGVGYPLVEEGRVTRIIGTIDDITEKVNRDQDLLYRATHDPLTGLANRRLLLQRLSEALLAGTPTFLLYLDLDQFKIINDSLGHLVGDELLQAVSKRLGPILDDGQLLARIGGDEFAIIGPGDKETGEQLAGELREAFAELLVLGETEIYITASFGVAHSGEGSSDALELLANADLALYQAKADGKNNVRTFEAEMRVVADRQLDLKNQIQRALKNDEFTVHYQPILVSASGAIRGVEALLRWHNGDEMISPASFLPYLEQSGLIIDVGEQVIRDTIAQLRTWTTTIPGTEELVMSLNLSRVQFRSTQLVDVLAEAISINDVRPSQVAIEITETAISEDAIGMTETLQTIRESGVHVAIDDFGVGKSSLSSLYELPANILKIDRSFIGRIEKPGPQPVIEAIVTMARARGLRTVAEGVETEVQRQYLTSVGCDYLQGYLLGRPMPPDQLASRLLDQWNTARP